MGTPNQFVRLAEQADASAMGQAQWAAWSQRHALTLPSDELPGAQELAGRWGEVLATPCSDPRTGLVLVAVEAGQVVGLLSAGATGDDDAIDGEVEISELVVHPDFAGSGHGSRLLAAWSDLSRAEGVPAALMWVTAADDELRGLLTDAGFSPDGATATWDLHGDGRVQVRMVRLSTLLEA